MTDRKLLELIADAAAHDYETLQSIAEQVHGWAKEDSISVTSAQIVAALSAAVREGYLRAYRYSATSSSFNMCEYDSAQSEDLYFLASEKGRELLT